MSETEKRELAAKAILVIYENKNYIGLCKSESPDWIDTTLGIGLEVAIATNSKIQQVSRINSKSKKSKKEEDIVSDLGINKNLHGSKVFISHTLFGSTIESPFYETISDKNYKLLNSYQKFEKNELFLFIADPLTNISDVLRMIGKIKLLKLEVYFSTMYFCIDDYLVKYLPSKILVTRCTKINIQSCSKLIQEHYNELLEGVNFIY